MAQRSRVSPRRSSPEPNTSSSLDSYFTAQVGERVILNAHIFDGDASTLSMDERGYLWKMQTPYGSNVNLSNPHMASPAFIPDVPGEYKASLLTPLGLATVIIMVSYAG